MLQSIITLSFTERIRILSRNSIKWIALICMLFDHTVKALQVSNSTLTYICSSIIGRIAFPLFCVLFIDGFFKIKPERYWKHIRELAFFGIISEIPFNLALNNAWISWKHQNIMLTWFFSFILLVILHWIFQKIPNFALAISVLIIGAFAVSGYFLKLDYQYCAFICVGGGYLLKKVLPKLNILWLCVLICLITISCYTTYFCGLACIPILLYDKNKFGKRQKYLHYVAYPAHLSILGILRLVLIG